MFAWFGKRATSLGEQNLSSRRSRVVDMDVPQDFYLLLILDRR